ncbi:MAG: cold-shock protein [Ignavibacteriales bacterium]
MPKGKIKKVIQDKGYGFIEVEEGREIFFHSKSLQGLEFKNVKEDDQVGFDVGKDRWNRPVAVNVRALR